MSNYLDHMLEPNIDATLRRRELESRMIQWREAFIGPKPREEGYRGGRRAKVDVATPGRRDRRKGARTFTDNAYAAAPGVRDDAPNVFSLDLAYWWSWRGVNHGEMDGKRPIQDERGNYQSGAISYIAAPVNSRFDKLFEKMIEPWIEAYNKLYLERSQEDAKWAREHPGQVKAELLHLAFDKILSEVLPTLDEPQGDDTRVGQPPLRITQYLDKAYARWAK